MEIQSLNIEGNAGDTKITLLLLTPNHTHSDRCMKPESSVAGREWVPQKHLGPHPEAPILG